MRKGMRQPQVSRVLGAKDAVTIAAEPVAARVARPLAMLEKEPNRPLLFGGSVFDHERDGALLLAAG